MQDVMDERSLQAAVLPRDLLGEPDLAIAQLVKSRLDLFFYFFDVRKLHKRIGFLRVLIGHIHLAGAGSQKQLRSFLHS